MAYDMPTGDERPIWDVLYSDSLLPAVAAADEVGLFTALADRPQTAEEVAARLSLNPRSVLTLMPALVALGLLASRAGRFALTDTARDYLLPESDFYWGPVLKVNSRSSIYSEKLVRRLREMTLPADPSERPAAGWESGQISLEQAQGIAAYMHGHSLASAIAVARHGDFSGVRRLLDVGGGSGCFSIAIARAHPEIRCTIMDLSTMCTVARDYIAAGEVSDRVDTAAVDMFREPWPTGYDAVFLSNVFHDWSIGTCERLARQAFDVLPSGGLIMLHEMLIADDRSGPRAAAAFSLHMLLNTQGHQFTFGELAAIVEQAGFVEPTPKPMRGYYSLVTARKP